MCSRNLTTNITGTLSDEIARAGEAIYRAEKIVVGIGAGLSAAGGFQYADEELVKRWYPEYYAMGVHTILDLQQMFWYLPNCEPERYWAYWAQHIWHIRYEAPATGPYLSLYRLLEGRDYFICTTNVDSQCEKAGFAPDRIFAMQGNYGFFQCSVPCSDELYDNRDMVVRMIKTMVSPFEIRSDEVPKCPRCGAPLIPNLRCDDRFVERPHLKNLQPYREFLEECAEKRTVFLELGVGYNTPGIIRYPFEQLTKEFPAAVLVRINSAQPSVPMDILERAVSVKADLGEALSDLAQITRIPGDE